MDYAGACSSQRDDRCFRLVYDEHGKPERCTQPLTVTGWVKIDRWYEVDACGEHVTEVTKARPYGTQRGPRAPYPVSNSQ